MAKYIALAAMILAVGSLIGNYYLQQQVNSLDDRITQCYKNEAEIAKGVSDLSEGVGNSTESVKAILHVLQDHTEDIRMLAGGQEVTRLNDPHTAPVAVTVRRGVWTRCAPREPGWYWYRSEVDAPAIVKYAGGEFTFNDMRCTAVEMLLDDGEFWSLPVEPPPEK